MNENLIYSENVMKLIEKRSYGGLRNMDGKNVGEKKIILFINTTYEFAGGFSVSREENTSQRLYDEITARQKKLIKSLCMLIDLSSLDKLMTVILAITSFLDKKLTVPNISLSQRLFFFFY